MSVFDDYVAMEPMFNAINGDFIALPQNEIDDNNSFLFKLLNTIVDKLREQNELFDLLFEQVLFGGSYWDRVKVSRPDEYDVYFQMVLDDYTQQLEPSNKNGWVNLKFENEETPGLHVLINEDGYLDTEKVMQWFHRTLSEALGGEKIEKYRYCKVKTSQGVIQMKFRRHGPAFTFSIHDIYDNDKIINVDIVPSFVFNEDQYPANGFERNPTQKGETFIVATPIKNHIGTRYWRLSFYNQERELMRGLDKFKPVLRLLKKMRDKLKHDCIASYFLKSVMLLEIRRRDETFWQNSLSFVFMSVLKFYQTCIKNGRIDFYWYRTDNLIAEVSHEELDRINDDLKTFIKEVDRNPKNIKLARYFLTRREFEQFKEEFVY